MRVVVLCARDIARTSSPTPSHDSTSTKDPSKRPAAHTADTPSSAAAGSCGAYCQLRYGGKVLRTPVVYDSTSPVWNWQFDMPLKAELGKQADGFVHDTVRVEVLNALTVGDPSVCGACKVSRPPEVCDVLSFTLYGSAWHESVQRLHSSCV